MYDYGQTNYYLQAKTSKTQNKKLPSFLLFGLILISFVILGKFVLNRKIPTKSNSTDYEFHQQNEAEILKQIQESKMISPLSSNPAGVNLEKISIKTIKTEIDNLTKGTQGKYGYCVQSLVTGESYGNYSDEEFTAASINKVPIILSFLKQIEMGKFRIDDIYSLDTRDKEAGTGGLQYQPSGSEYSYKELIMSVGKHSDNTAVNAMVRIQGEEAIYSLLKELNLNKTSIEKNLTTPREMVSLFSFFYHKKVISSQNLINIFWESLTKTDFETRIPAGVPNNVVVAHKIGNQIQVWSDCGVVFAPKPYAICILTDGIKESEAQQLLPQISGIVWKYEGLK